MARTVKKQEYTEKRNEILSAAQRLVFTKGYERLTIQDIQAELNISSGAFYHYFDSKPALLEAVIERMMQDAEKPLFPVVEDLKLTAIEKLQRFLGTLESLRDQNRGFLSRLAKVWYADDNAIVRLKVNEAVIERRAPLIDKIIQQGIQEGSFTLLVPDRTGEVIISLLEGMGTTHAKLLFSLEQAPDQKVIIHEMLSVYRAYMTAIERILGTPARSLYTEHTGDVEEWAAALKDTHKIETE
jgi:AcrR family transcriptional regulator